MTLAGYFDESEKRFASEPLSVAGYLFKPTAYKQFVRGWRRILRSVRVDHLHMTDLFAGEQAFDGLSVQRRGEILSEAVAVINDHMTAGIGLAVRQAEFEAFAPPDWPNIFGSIYSTLCQGCIELSGMWMDDHRRRDRINYFFESGHKFRHEADRMLDAIGADAEYAVQGHYGSHTFMDKRTACGLQAADVLAWAATKEFGWEEAGESIREPFLRVLREMASDRGRYSTKLFQKDALKEWIRHQLEALAGGERRVTATVPPHRRTFR